MFGYFYCKFHDTKRWSVIRKMMAQVAMRRKCTLRLLCKPHCITSILHRFDQCDVRNAWALVSGISTVPGVSTVSGVSIVSGVTAVSGVSTVGGCNRYLEGGKGDAEGGVVYAKRQGLPNIRGVHNHLLPLPTPTRL